MHPLLSKKREPNCDSRFARRANGDGSLDSVCKACFATIKTSSCEADLDLAERNHACDQEELKRLVLCKKDVRTQA